MSNRRIGTGGWYILAFLFILSSPTHSQREAVVGSTLAGRRAGNKHAAIAMAASNDAVLRT